MRDVIGAYQNAVAGEVARYEGHIAKFMGDGVLAYFGYPKAHEDDAERAVRAGLELVRSIGGLAAAGRPLAARVGIATGLVVVGDLIGEGAAQEQAVVGETPNLAGRLQALANPGTVVVAPSTRRLLGGLFEFADLGAHALKGFTEPIRAGHVLGEGRAEGRFEALHGAQLTPLVGREHELAILMERWARAKDGEGQMVLISGEPGIGKSRLIRVLRQELSGEPHLALSHFCSPYHTTARFTRSSRSWSEPRPLPPMTSRRPSSPSWKRCSVRRRNSWRRACRSSRRCWAFLLGSATRPSVSARSDRSSARSRS
jgi:hypothetical protein